MSRKIVLVGVIALSVLASWLINSIPSWGVLIAYFVALCALFIYSLGYIAKRADESAEKGFTAFMEKKQQTEEEMKKRALPQCFWGGGGPCSNLVPEPHLLWCSGHADLIVEERRKRGNWTPTTREYYPNGEEC